jgi:hypothetical protein
MLKQDKIYLYGMGVWKQISEYFILKKDKRPKPPSKWTGYMHNINRLAILLFIVAMIILAIKLLT